MSIPGQAEQADQSSGREKKSVLYFVAGGMEFHKDIVTANNNIVSNGNEILMKKPSRNNEDFLPKNPYVRLFWQNCGLFFIRTGIVTGDDV